MTAPEPSVRPEPAASPLFEGRGLTCIRGERVVFTGLDFTLAPGEALLLLGPNGSGKSSFLRLLAGLIRPAAGALTWDGAPVRDEREDHGARSRYIGHLDAVKPVLSVAENISFWVRTWAPDTRDVAAAVQRGLECFAMDRLADVPGKMLSAGQKRRVNLARLVAAPAPLWLLDEPTTALDKASIKVLEACVAEHRAAGGMVALSTHSDIDLPGARTFHMDDFAADTSGAWDALDAEWEAAQA
ncbi:MAG: heme ABC exporter ATP-binding protein CcmA [Rhodospirillaceae bacterium]